MKPTISIGVSQFQNETPAKIKLIYRWLMFLSAVWMVGIEPRFPALSAALLHNIDSGLAIANFAIYSFCNCFGYVAPDNIQPVPETEAIPHTVVAALTTAPAPDQTAKP